MILTILLQLWGKILSRVFQLIKPFMALLMFNQTAALTSSHIGLPVNLQQSLQYKPSGLLQYITFTQEEHLRKKHWIDF